MAVPNFNPYYPPNYNQNFQPQPAIQVQNGGFIPVPSEDVARNYPVAPGNSVTFKNENAPYVYTKTMGFSQLDRPLFEKYKLVKEEDEVSQEPAKEQLPDYKEMLDSSIVEIHEQIQSLWKEVDVLREKATRRTQKAKDDRSGRYDKQPE